MSATVTPILELPVEEIPTITTATPANLIPTKPVQYVWTKMPVHHDFYRHTFLSWARLRKQPTPVKAHPEVVIIEKPLSDVEEMPIIEPLGTGIDTEAVKRLVNYIALVGLSVAFVVASLIIGIVSLVYALQPKVPTGTILPYSGNAATFLQNDDQWLFCDGSAVSRTKYSALFLVIGTTYGTGNGADTFNLPDLRGRFLWGSSGVNDTVLLSGGTASHTLTVAQMPVHTHNPGTLGTVANGVHSHTYTQTPHNHAGATSTAWHPSGGVWLDYGSTFYGYTDIVNGAHAISADNANINIDTAGNHNHAIIGATATEGLSQPFDKMPPYQTIHYIIRI